MALKFPSYRLNWSCSWGLQHNHSNSGSKPILQSTLHLAATWDLNPLRKARDRTHILAETTLVLNPLSHNGNSNTHSLPQGVAENFNRQNKVASHERGKAPYNSKETEIISKDRRGKSLDFREADSEEEWGFLCGSCTQLRVSRHGNSLLNSSSKPTIWEAIVNRKERCFNQKNQQPGKKRTRVQRPSLKILISQGSF